MAETFTLEELSDRSGVPARLIRSYIEEKLLRGPASKGRYASYGAYHLDRLLAIRALRSQGLSLGDIRVRLLSMSDEQIAHTGELAGAGEPATALEYLRRIADQVQPRRSAVADARAARAGPALRSSRSAGGEAALAPLTRPREDRTSFERLLFSLQELLAGQRVERQARGEPWYRIPVTPEIELQVRGELTAEAMASLERLADYLRVIALGGLGPPAPT